MIHDVFLLYTFSTIPTHSYILLYHFLCFLMIPSYFLHFEQVSIRNTNKMNEEEKFRQMQELLTDGRSGEPVLQTDTICPGVPQNRASYRAPYKGS